MKRNYVRALSVCITAAMVLAQPTAVLAASTEQTAAAEDVQESDVSGTEQEDEAPSGTGDEDQEPPEEGNDGQDTEENGDAGEGEDGSGEKGEDDPAEGDGNDNEGEEKPDENDGNDSDEGNDPAEGDGEEDPSEGDGEEDPSGDDGEEDQAGDDGKEDPSEGDGKQDPSEGDEKEDPSEGNGKEDPSEADGNGTDGKEDPAETDGKNDPNQKDENGNGPKGETEDKVPEDEKEELTEEEKKKLLEEEKLLEEKKLLEKKLLIEVEEEEEVRAVNGEWNIRDFGAGNGDSTTAIQNALNSVTSGASTVRIPKGTYNFSRWLSVSSNTKIVFEDGAVLKGNGSHGGLLLQGSNITVEKPAIENVSTGIKVDTNSSKIYITGGNIQSVSGAGIELWQNENTEVNGLTVTGCKFGFLVTGGKNLRILNNKINNQAQGCIWLKDGTSDATINSNTIKGGSDAGIWLSGVNNVTVSSNTIEENGDGSKQSSYGIKITYSSNQVKVHGNTVAYNKKDGINVDGGCNGISLTENRILSNGAIGVGVGGGSSIDIVGNEIKQNQGHGIILMSSYANIRGNNIDGTNSVGNVTRADHYGIIIFCRNSSDKNKVIEITNNTVSGMTGNGIQVTGDKANPGNEGAVNVLVSGNQIRNVGDNGITVNYNSHNANITGNMVEGAGVNGIDIQGGSKNCRIANNTVNRSGHMGISIGTQSTAAGVEITGNIVDGSKNVGIHVTNSASTATISKNQVLNHSGNYSIAAVNNAKVSLASNTVIMPMDYISKYNDIVKNAIFIAGGAVSTNGAEKFNFVPKIPSAGATSFTGTGTPGLTVILNLNGTAKNAAIDSKWNYSIACSALKASDNYTVSAKDKYENMISYTNGTVSASGPVTNIVDKAKVKAFVERMYTVALNRPADAGGCDYWVEQLATGAKDGSTVAKGFILSGEMERRKLNNDQFVTVLYKALMNREPSANDDGRKYWVNLLNNGVSRAFVFRGFSQSNEFASICNNYGIIQGSVKLTDNRDQNKDITMYVYRCYNRTLNRQPDEKGMNFWTGEILQKKRTPTDVAGNFVFSTEFKNRKYSDEEYVKILYRMFFDREYDAKGLAFWVNELKTGKRDRYSVFLGFANSNEFAAVLKSFNL